VAMRESRPAFASARAGGRNGRAALCPRAAVSWTNSRRGHRSFVETSWLRSEGALYSTGSACTITARPPSSFHCDRIVISLVSPEYRIIAMLSLSPISTLSTSALVTRCGSALAISGTCGCRPSVKSATTASMCRVPRLQHGRSLAHRLRVSRRRLADSLTRGAPRGLLGIGPLHPDRRGRRVFDLADGRV
jgi:hypothetical protein